jgi:flagellar FliL protein
LLLPSALPLRRDILMASKAKAAAVDEEEDEEGESQPAASKWKLPFKLPSLPSKKVIIIAAAAFVLVAGGGAVAYFMLAGGKEVKAEAPPVKPPVFVDVPEVLVNLSNSGADRVQYLKVKIVLEVADATLTPQIQSTMPRVLDAFQTYLRELRPTDLDGSAGLYRLKEELTRRVNAAIAPSRINAVLFKEIVIQ